MGLLHEHQRPDRDKYINIDMKAAARTGAIKQFEKASFHDIVDRKTLNELLLKFQVNHTIVLVKSVC